MIRNNHGSSCEVYDEVPASELVEHSHQGLKQVCKEPPLCSVYYLRNDQMNS